MTPLFGKSYDPDERPSAGELIGAIILALAAALLWWLASIIYSTP